MSSHLSNERIKNFVHSIHDFIRNNGGGYGQDALRILVFIYGLMRIESHEEFFQESELYKPLSNECRFSYLYSLKEQCDLLNEKFFTVILNIQRHPVLKKLIYSDIPKNVSPTFYPKLIEMVYDVMVMDENGGVVGKIYEYFIGRDEKALSDLGICYTEKWIINHIFQKYPIKLLNDKEIKSFIDPFGGSGGFTVKYVQEILKLNPLINWHENIKKI